MMYPEKYINKMKASLNCIFLGMTAFSDSFTADIAFGDKLKDLTEEQICKDSEQLVPITHFKKYFPDQDAVDKSLIFVQVPATETVKTVKDAIDIALKEWWSSWNR
ncbi:unnamed protein product [Rhizophagus irregularis]|nr:unnamed protein product [Rhizophagus irregularis]